MNLRQWRTINNRSLFWVAKRLDVTYQAVQKWETQGLDSYTRITEIEKLTGGDVRPKDWLKKRK